MKSSGKEMNSLYFKYFYLYVKFITPTSYWEESEFEPGTDDR
jgi:hypothetical protein